MPIFEYKCNKCGQVMEFLEKSGGAQKHKCEKCGSSDVQKMMSGFAVGQGKNNCDYCPKGPAQAECGGECCR